MASCCATSSRTARRSAPAAATTPRPSPSKASGPSGWAGVRLRLSAQRPRDLIVHANGRRVLVTRIGPQPRDVGFEATTDARGALLLRLHAALPDAPHFRLSALEVRVQGVPAFAPRRVAGYALFGALWAALAGWLAGARRRGAVLAVLAIVAAAAAALALARLRTLALAGPALMVPGLAVAWLGLGELGLPRLGLPRRTARWVAAALLLKLGFVVQSSFPCIDLHFHAVNVQKLRDGELISSKAPGPGGALAVPYPPLLYALLAPLPSGSVDDDAVHLRLALGLLEGLSPLLLFALMRAGRAPPELAGDAAATLAVMPEGLLVLAKGIAPNALGGALTLLLLARLVAGASFAVTTGLLALVLLSHLGVSLSVLPLLVLWAAVEVAVARPPLRALLPPLAGVAAALVLAWLAYYGEMVALLGGAFGSVTSAAPHVHWVRAGKLLQDLLLKFGLLPLLLAGAGVVALRLTSRIQRLVAAWLLTAALLGGVAALLTPVVLRFEYFSLPAVAAAAGFGAERLRRGGRGAWIGAVWGFSFAVQVALAVAIQVGAFDLIDVILESPRWSPLAWLG